MKFTLRINDTHIVPAHSLHSSWRTHGALVLEPRPPANIFPDCRIPFPKVDDVLPLLLLFTCFFFLFSITEQTLRFALQSFHSRPKQIRTM